MDKRKRYLDESEEIEYIDGDDLLEDFYADGEDRAAGYDMDEEEIERAYEDYIAADEEAYARRKRPDKGGKNRKLLITAGAVAAACILLVAGAIIIKIVSPNKEFVNIYQHLNISNAEIAVYWNLERIDAEAVLQDGSYYLESSFVSSYMTDKFYFDINEENFIYTTATEIWTIPLDSTEYDIDGTSVSYEKKIAVRANDGLYLSLDFILEYAPCGVSCTVFHEPERIMFVTAGTTYLLASFSTQSKDCTIREEATIKGAIVAKPLTEDVKWFREEERDEGSWLYVYAEDGRKGYIKRNEIVADSYLTTTYDADSMPEYPNQLRDYDIILAWHGVYSLNDNNKIAGLLENAEGLTTVSPTWYKVIDVEGNVSSMADADYVAYIHEQGMEIWPLISDFTSADAAAGWDEKAMLSNTAARTKLIETLMQQAELYGFDGWNIDFEKVPSDAGADYIQFIRELSIACRKAGLVLSVDNYVPKAYNAQYKRAAQGECVDYVIVMGYDEHWAGCEEAGSVASLPFIVEGLDNTLLEVPAEKVIHAVPFYTRLWIEGTDEEGNYKLTSQSLGMQAGADFVADNGLMAVWDETAGQYVAAGVVGDVTYSIWLEDEASMQARITEVRKRNVAGIAAWCLGFEKETIWDILTLE